MKTKIFKLFKKDRSNIKMKMSIKSKQILQSGRDSITIISINHFHKFYRKKTKIQKKKNKQ
jgi:hypothetical protein